MSRRALPLLLLCLLAVALPRTASASAAQWRSEQPLTEGSIVPEALGTVYDIEFWSPNRGALITAEGVWAYDGTTWHRYSTVCGGTGGRIAWAGPTEFWTISDQRSGQVQPERIAELHAISLCHFVNGAVVASYAEPTGIATSYKRMNAAACLGPNNCWFAGELLSGEPNAGAFHLHWNGATLTAFPSMTQIEPEMQDPPRPISSMAVFGGSVFESVRAAAGAVPGETSEQPNLLHQIVEESTAPEFVSILQSPAISYGGARPEELAGFQISADSSALWGIAGRAGPTGSGTPVIAFRYTGENVEQLKFKDSAGLFAALPLISAIAAVPGQEEAWVGYVPPVEFGHPRSVARLALLHSDGTVDTETLLPSETEELSRKGAVGAIACPAAEQCWMATTGGWLFHLGPDLPRDEAPAMHQLITYRPPDGSTQSLPPDTLPIDDSGSEPKAEEPTEPPLKGAKRRPLPARVTKVKQQLVGKTLLELSFTLTAKARVQLIARRHGKVVAKTPLAMLTKGRHQLKLRLDPKHWPTKFHLTVKPAGKKS